MSDDDVTPASVRWARLRLQVVGSLLASPSAERGALKERLAELAAQRWKHPTTGESVRFSFKTIEKWYYLARDASDPIAALARKVHSHAGTHPTVSLALGEAIRAQHRAHPRWTYQLHHDNLVALAKERPELDPVPGYATIARFMKAKGLLRVRKKRSRKNEDAGLRETRSYEVTHVNALWHLDFHEGSRAVLLASGEWKKPMLLGVLDDHSRLCCHAQWYLDETAEALCHGLMQAILKRGLPRAIMMDNGSAMKAAETQEGLLRLGIEPALTLEYSPEQNGKQESFWARIEGRVIAMLEGHEPLELDLLNRATLAWVEQEYHRSEHSEIGTTPLGRFLHAPNVGRQSPDATALRRAFRMLVRRHQRRSDGTVSVEGVRFEVPSAYRHLVRLSIRIARWDLSSVDHVDPRTGAHLCTLLPLDKAKNADRRRRAIVGADEGPRARSGIAPLLQQLMAEHAATGLPPGYLTQRRLDDGDDDDEQEDSR